MIEFLSKTIKQEKDIKGIQIKKKELKIFLFADNMILYVKDPKDSTRKHLALINTFRKVTE
jgi:hypothetical protein